MSAILNEIDARTLRYATKAISNLYLEAKQAQQKALDAVPLDWDRYTRYSAECYALAGALGCLGITELPTLKEAK